MSAKPQPRTPFEKVLTQLYAMPEWGQYSDTPASQAAFKAALLRILGAHGWTRKSFIKALDREGWGPTTAMRKI